MREFDEMVENEESGTIEYVESSVGLSGSCEFQLKENGIVLPLCSVALSIFIYVYLR